MGQCTRLIRYLGCGVAGAALIGGMATTGSAQGKGKPGSSAVTGPSGWVNPLAKRYVSGPPLNVCDQGSFFVGGVPKVTNFGASAVSEGVPQQLIIGQMYVQFQIPQVRRGWPLIMVHGSGYTGAALDATPDGREGWFARAVKNDIATFIVDQSGRARSGFDRSILHEARITGNLSMIPTMGGATSNSMWTSWLGHLIPAGSNILDGTLIRHGDPGDPDSPERHGNYPPAYPIPPVPNSIDPLIAARMGALGPAPNPANNTFLALQTYKQLVPNTESTLPGSFCAPCSPQTLGPTSTWTPLALADLVEGLGGAVIATHSQSGIMGHHAARILKERGKLNSLKGLITIEGSCSLTNSGLDAADFDNVPYLAFKGDYTNTSAVCQQTVDAIDARRSAGLGTAAADYIKLDDPEFGEQFNGVTHMMMLDTKSNEVFDVILDWAGRNITGGPKAASCGVGKK